MSETSSEGNWTCSICGNDNYPTRTRCNMRKCNAPRGATTQDNGGNGGGYSGTKRGYGSEYDNYSGGQYREDQRKRPRSQNPYHDPQPYEYPRNTPGPVGGLGMGMGMGGMGYGDRPLDMAPYGRGYEQYAMRDNYRGAPYPRQGMYGGASENEEMWTCLECGNRNYQSRTQCNMRKCGAKRPRDNQPIYASPYPSAYPPQPRYPLQQRPGEERGWTCSGCRNVNYAHREKCNMRKCGMSREESDRLVKENEEKRNRDLDEMEGVWVCPKCQNRNFAHRTKCNMRKCQAPRPDAAAPVVTESPSNQPADQAQAQIE